MDRKRVLRLAYRGMNQMLRAGTCLAIVVVIDYTFVLYINTHLGSLGDSMLNETIGGVAIMFKLYPLRWVLGGLIGLHVWRMTERTKELPGLVSECPTNRL